MTTGIYKITNTINGHSYIGQSKNIEARWKRHKASSQNPNDKGYEYPLYRAFRKYGLDCFDFEIIEECAVEELNEREKYWISQYDSFFNGYNQTLGGDSTGGQAPKEYVIGIFNDLLNTNIKHADLAVKWGVSTELVQGINTGRYWYTDNFSYPLQKLNKREQCYCQNCNQPISFGALLCLSCQHQKQQENQPSKEELLQTIEKCFGNFTAVGKTYSVSPTTIRRWCVKYGLSSSADNYKDKKEFNVEKMQKAVIVQYDLSTGQKIAEFQNGAEAAKAIGKSSKEGSHILAVCKGKRKTAYGYGWCYKI